MKKLILVLALLYGTNNNAQDLLISNTNVIQVDKGKIAKGRDVLIAGGKIISIKITMQSTHFSFFRRKI